MSNHRSIQFTVLSSIFQDAVKPSINRFDQELPEPSQTPTPTVTPSTGAFSLDFDYAVLKYVWEAPNGTDLDTRTSLSEVERFNDVGWSRLPNDEDYIIWGRDNQSPVGAESALINYARIKQDFPDTTDIRCSLRAFWYTSKFDGNVKLEFTTYKGGTMQRVGTEFVNVRGELVAEVTADVNVPTVESANIDGDDIADLVFDTILNRGSFEVKIPAVTPTPTITPTQTRTPTITATVTPTNTRTLTPTPTNGATPTPTTSFTPTVSLTPTITPSNSTTPSITPTISLTPTLTVSPTVGASPTTIPPSRTAEPTFTPTRTPAVSITATSTPVPPTPTPTNTVTPTVTATISLTPTPTKAPSVTPTITPTIGSSRTPTVTPTVTATISLTPTITRTITPQPTVSRSITPSNTPDPSKSATPNPTPTLTPTSTVTPTVTLTPTPSGVATLVQGEQVFTQSGTFVVPQDVFSVHVVAVGGTRQVQADNPTPSTFGTIFNSNTPLGQSINGSIVGGGNGGTGGQFISGSGTGSGAGGAGGYVGNGGNGAFYLSTSSAPSGTGGGGGGGSASRGGRFVGGVGGGVYLYGINLDNTPSGAGGEYPSGASPGLPGQPGGIPIGQPYGQGWVYTQTNGGRVATNGGNLRYLNNISVTPGQSIPISIFKNGAVRVVWGQGREFPYNASDFIPAVTPSPTPTRINLSLTPTVTPTVTFTSTPSATPTVTPTSQATLTPTTTLTPTVTRTPAITPTVTQTGTITPTVTLSVTPTPTASGLATLVKGEQIFSSSGSFTVPADVFSVSVVAVAGTGQTQSDSVTPTSFGSVFNTNTVLGTSINGSIVGGGNGGLGGLTVTTSGGGSGGGGAGGYVGNGGNGADRLSTSSAPSGTGGGGGGGSASRGGSFVGGIGGGVYLYGINLDDTPSGAGGEYPSGASPGLPGQPGGIPIGQPYGQGWTFLQTGGGRRTSNGGNLRYLNNISVTPGQVIPISIFRNGGLRVIWGPGQSFPYNASEFLATPTPTPTSTVTPTVTRTITPTMTPSITATPTAIAQHFLRFEGPDGSATFTDDGGSVWQVSSGSPVISTAAFAIEERGLLLNGSSSIRSLTPVDLRGSDFTLEAWIRPSTLSSGGSNGVTVLSRWENQGFILSVNQNGSVGFAYAPASTAAAFMTTTAGLVTASTWSHIAVTRTGTTFRIFVNGTVAATATNGVEVSLNTAPIYIGTYTISGTDRNWNYTGSIENVRIVKTSLYTGNFIPSPAITPTPSVTPTRTPTPTVTPSASAISVPSTPQSLMFFEGANGSTAFTDETGKIWSRSAGSTTAISTTFAAGGTSSLLVDGSTGVIGTDSNISDFTFNADFTVEMFIRQSAVQSGNKLLFLNCSDAVPSTGIGLYMLSNTSNVAVYDYVGNNVAITSSVPVVIGQWTHVALCRIAGVLRLFVNGQLAGSVSRSAAYVATTGNVAIGGVRTGAFAPGTNYAVFSGNIDSFRVFNSVGIYQNAFTPPNPNNLSVSDFTQTRLSFDDFDGSSNIVDEGPLQLNWTANGNARIRSSQSRFGGSSLQLPGGTNDFMTTPYISSFDWYNRDFTIQSWVYPTNLATWSYNDGPFSISNMLGNAVPTSTSNFWSFGPRSNGTIALTYFTGTVQQVATTATISPNVWSHIALTKQGNTLRIFINGILSATGTLVDNTQKNLTTVPLLVIGKINNSVSTGFIDEFDIQHRCIWTTDFTPPTSEIGPPNPTPTISQT